MPSEQYIVDNGGSVWYRGYSIEVHNLDDKPKYYATHNSDFTKNIGECKSVAQVKRFIRELTGGKVWNAQQNGGLTP